MADTETDDTAGRGPDHGTVVDLDGRRSLRFVRRFATDRADVWSAITDTERTGRWAFATTFEPRVGGAVRFDFAEAGPAFGTVLVWDEPTVLEYEWAEGDSTWRIRFELSDDGDGRTTLTFDHFLPDPTRGEYAAGWHWHLDRLVQHLAGDDTADVEEDEHFHRLMEEYGAR